MKIISGVFLFFCYSSVAFADFIRILPTYEVGVYSEKQEIEIEFDLKNDGDVAAKEVSLSFPSLNESYLLSKSMEPNATAHKKLNFSFSQLKMEKNGKYFLPLRVEYKDVNYYRLSASFLIPISYPPEPATGLSVRFEGLDNANFVNVADSVKGKVEFSNISTSDMIITNVYGVTANELIIDIPKRSFPVTVPPSGNIPVEFKVIRQNALPGSTYALSVVVEGESGDKHFAEEARFFASIKAQVTTDAVVLYSVYGLLGVFIIVSGFVCRMRYSKKNELK